MILALSKKKMITVKLLFRLVAKEVMTVMTRKTESGRKPINQIIN